MTTSNPNVPQPAGAADPHGEGDDRTVDPLLESTVRGAVPDERLGQTAADEEPDPEADRVEDDRKRSGAG